MIERLGEDTQTLHAELMALLLASEGDRQWSHLAGSFSSKTVAGIDYVYFQYSDPGGKKRQFSLGPRNDAVDRLVRGYRESRSAREEEMERVARLAGLLAAAGAAKVPAAPARVLQALADAGVFRLGGVLVGSHAFLVLGNMLGVAWPAATWRTQDVDIASHLEIAAPHLEADVPRALDNLMMGFVPVPPFDPRHTSSSFKVRGRELRVDLLTPGSDRDEAPVYIPRFKAAAAPIKFLSLLMEGAGPAAAVHGSATLVVVPAPARFALHKLLVSQTRSLVQQTKAAKDVHQAALLLEVLAGDRPEDLRAAAKAFNLSGPAVTRKVARGLDAVEKRWPDANAGVTLARRCLRT